MRKYVIACEDTLEDLYWSNEWGWTSREEASVFTEDEKQSYGDRPVIEGYWVPA